MAVTHYLIDKSALVHLFQRPQERWTSAMERALVHACSLTLLEVGVSARSGPNWRTLQQGPPISLLVREHLTPAMEDRALEVQMLLADRGQHRAPSIPDLLIAATAELAGLTVLAVDKDYDLIAAVTGQPVRWLD